jgi:FAD/FMN-containing dehydrogenase
MNAQQEAYLKKFGNRATFDKTERMLYGHDIAAMPNLVKPLVGNTTPDAVVQPQNEEELVEVVRWAYEQGIPITPRGKASSGYGGVIPVKKGLVVDFYQMKDVLAVDEEGLTVTVQPGVTWEQLDKKLKPRGLTLRLYPTSYPSSSVGGWLAQGGAGIGSYEYGYFRQSVVSARVVLPMGEVREFDSDDPSPGLRAEPQAEGSGQGLDLIADAEGITGLISQVTVRVQPLEELDVVSLACPDAHELQKLIDSMINAELPIWSMVFINPRMAEMKNRAPLMEHYGHPVEERVLLPAAYVLTLAFRASDSETVRAALPELIKPCEAEILSDRITHHEWEHRFKLMVVKRLGPSLVPAEVIVPLTGLGDVMTEIERKVDQPVVKEGVIIREGPDGEPEVVILGFIPSDQRRFSYNFVFGLVLTIMKIAEKYGGRAYATGLYFSQKANDVLGADRAGRLRDFKKQVDPKGLLNPGKVIGNGLLGTALNLASAFEPLIRPFGNAVITSHPTWPGMPMPVPNAATALTSATSSTGVAGRARALGASGIGCESIWKAAPIGTRTWWTPSWSAPPASCATCAVRRPCPSSPRG